MVLDDASVPLGAGDLPDPGRRVLVAGLRPEDVPAAHTLRELEDAARGVRSAAPRSSEICALAFDAGVFPPGPGESVGAFLDRLRGSGERSVDARFGAFRAPDSYGPRPEIAALVPATARRVLDVGCRDGAAAAAWKSGRPGISVAGIERDPAFAAAAATRLDRVLAGEASPMLAVLAREGARFDAVLFADVLEHLIDPIDALESALRIAAPGATLVVSVPNVGHLSVVRDLLAGRFDAVPCGLLDASHVRFFTRRGLADTIEASGWTLERVVSAPGSPPDGAEEFLRWAAGRPGVDAESLRTYQWLAVARSPGVSDGRA